MSTTNLFVELLVIGVGASAAVALAVMAVTGIDGIDAAWFQSYPILALMLAASYLLGIIIDRVSDKLFDILFSGPIRRRYFSDRRDYQDARRIVLLGSPRLADMHEYGRTRLRICRGWSVNAILIAAALHAFARWQLEESTVRLQLQWWGTNGFLLLAGACWWSWYQLCSMEYLKIREHAEFIRALSGGGLLAAQHEPVPRLHEAA